MKKISTLFERDFTGDPSRVINKINPVCEWVRLGQGIPTRKLDGTCCLIRDGKLFKRREVREGQHIPEGYEQVDMDETTGKGFGWVPVGDGPDDRWHREAFDFLLLTPGEVKQGTYELIGPKIQGNSERMLRHYLVPHGADPIEGVVPRDFEGLLLWFSVWFGEGVVWHHPDGRMAKIKGRDFGYRRHQPKRVGWLPASPEA